MPKSKLERWALGPADGHSCHWGLSACCFFVPLALWVDGLLQGRGRWHGAFGVRGGGVRGCGGEGGRGRPAVVAWGMGGGLAGMHIASLGSFCFVCWHRDTLLPSKDAVNPSLYHAATPPGMEANHFGTPVPPKNAQHHLGATGKSTTLHSAILQSTTPALLAEQTVPQNPAHCTDARAT